MQDSVITHIIVYAERGGTGGAIVNTDVRDAFIVGCLVGGIVACLLIILFATYMDNKQRRR